MLRPGPVVLEAQREMDAAQRQSRTITPESPVGMGMIQVRLPQEEAYSCTRVALRGVPVVAVVVAHLCSAQVVPVEPLALRGQQLPATVQVEVEAEIVAATVVPGRLVSP